MCPSSRSSVTRDRDGNEVYRREGGLWLQLKKEHGPRFLGRIRAGVLIIERPKPEHFYRNGPGWCFNAEVFKHHVELGIVNVRFIAKWKMVDATFPVEKMIAAFVPITKYKAQGFEKQMLLRQEFFGLYDRETLETPAPAKTQKKQSERDAQLVLFF